MTGTLTETTTARELFRAAYENRYTWDSNFPGYTADVTLQQGDKVHGGKIRINPDLSFEVTDVTDEQVKRSIHSQVWEIAVHRVRRPFEQTHGQNTFTFGETDETGAVEVLVSGKAMGDRYKVRNNEVCLVHRHIHGKVVTIHTFSSHQTDEGYLSHQYDSIYSDPQTGETQGERTLFDDNYEKVGNYYILSRRTITVEGNSEPMVYLFSNIQLMQ